MDLKVMRCIRDVTVKDLPYVSYWVNMERYLEDMSPFIGIVIMNRERIVMPLSSHWHIKLYINNIKIIKMLHVIGMI